MYPHPRLLIALGLYLLPSLLWCQDPARVTTSIRRFEIGGQATDLRLGTCFGFKGCSTPQFGLGPAVAFNINPSFALDGELNLLTGVDNVPSYFDDGSITGGRVSELLAGPRFEKRARHYGYFLNAKPGLLSWSNTVTGRRNSFALKVGGGVEYSPSTRLHLRIDMGDLLVRYNDSRTAYCNACVRWTSNLQTTAGMYWGVGRPIASNATPKGSGRTHEFFGTSNLVLLGVSLLAQTADAVTTQRNLSHGALEEDPLAAPFVKYGWSGQIGLAVLTNGAQILGMYGLHRMGAHWIERAIPLSFAAASALSAYGNAADH